MVVGIEVEDLGDLIVGVAIEFDDLRVPAVVVDGAIADFNSDSTPPGDGVEDSPGETDVWLFESSVDDDV